MKFIHFNSTTFQGRVYCLTSVIDALKSFQDFSPNIKTAAIALHAQELGINSLHYYAIAHLALLRGEG